MIITVDGSAGVGKGTLCLYLSKEFNSKYLDSGAIYRSLAYALSNTSSFKDILQKDTNEISEEEINKIVYFINCSLVLDFSVSNNKVETTISINKGPIKNITDEIRSEQISMLSSKLAAIHQIRIALIDLQRSFTKYTNLVADGRDMGTTIFPNAEIKLFLEASAEVRANRRYQQLLDNGISADYNEILNNIIIRDEQDKNRSSSPMIPAKDAYIIDTSNLNQQEVLELATEFIRSKL